MRPSILSPVQTIVLGSFFPSFVDVTLESHRTVMAAFSLHKQMDFRYNSNDRAPTFRLTIRAEKRGITEYSVILCLHVACDP